MTRTDLLAAVIAVLTPSPRPKTARPPISVDVSIVRDGLTPLAPFTVGIALRNTTRAIVRLDFPTADLFRIDLIRDEAPVWSSTAGHRPIPVNRRIDVPPGTLKLASWLIDGTTDDHRALAAGKYVVRVAMLGTTFGAVIDRTLEIAPPLTVAEAAATRLGTVVSVEGEPYVEAGVPRLRDASGTLRLAHSLGIRPAGKYVVRGFADAMGDERVFAISRYAPSFDNVPASPGTGI